MNNFRLTTFYKLLRYLGCFFFSVAETKQRKQNEITNFNLFHYKLSFLTFPGVQNCYFKRYLFEELKIVIVSGKKSELCCLTPKDSILAKKM